MISLAVLFAVWLLCLPLSTWIFYVALMHADKLHAEGLLEPTALCIMEKILILAQAHNFALNWTWMTGYFLDLPREGPTTARLNRLTLTGSAKQKAKVEYIRKVFLNNFDRHGIHT